MEAGSIQIIAVPLLLPILKALDVDLVHFGIVLTVNLAIGMLTPPFGLCLFTSAKVINANLKDTIAHLWPFLFSMIAVLLLITFIAVSCDVDPLRIPVISGATAVTE